MLLITPFPAWLCRHITPRCWCWYFLSLRWCCCFRFSLIFSLLIFIRFHCHYAFFAIILPCWYWYADFRMPPLFSPLIRFISAIIDAAAFRRADIFYAILFRHFRRYLHFAFAWYLRRYFIELLRCHYFATLCCWLLALVYVISIIFAATFAAITLRFRLRFHTSLLFFIIIFFLSFIEFSGFDIFHAIIATLYYYFLRYY